MSTKETIILIVILMGSFVIAGLNLVNKSKQPDKIYLQVLSVTEKQAVEASQPLEILPCDKVGCTSLHPDSCHFRETTNYVRVYEIGINGTNLFTVSVAQ